MWGKVVEYEELCLYLQTNSKSKDSCDLSETIQRKQM